MNSHQFWYVAAVVALFPAYSKSSCWGVRLKKTVTPDSGTRIFVPMSDDYDEVPECLCGEMMTIATIKKRWNCSVCGEAKAACSLRWNCSFCDRDACEECAWNQEEVEENGDEQLEETLGLDLLNDPPKV